MNIMVMAIFFSRNKTHTHTHTIGKYGILNSKDEDDHHHDEKSIMESGQNQKNEKK